MSEISDEIRESALGLLESEEKTSDGTRMEGVVLTSELEDLESVLGNGDSDALEEFVVEIENVFVFELVLS